MIVLVAVVMLMLTSLSNIANGAEVNFAGYPFWTNGSARIAGNALELTPNLNRVAGSAFIHTPFNLVGNPSFHVFFQFRITGGTDGADGFTFMIQNDQRGLQALGGVGGNLGYQGISSSIAVEFDDFQHANFSDPNNNHIGIDTNGAMTSLVTATPNFDINSGDSYYVWIDYSGTTNALEIFTNTTNSKPASPILSRTIDVNMVVGNTAYIGFSAGTGGRTNQHLIENFSLSGFDASSANVPTMDQNGLILLGIILGSASFIWIRKKGNRY